MGGINTEKIGDRLKIGKFDCLIYSDDHLLLEPLKEDFSKRDIDNATYYLRSEGLLNSSKEIFIELFLKNNVRLN